MISDPEIVIILKNISDKLASLPTIYHDHVFMPDINIPSTTVKQIDVNAYLIKLTAKYADIKVNFNRNITPTEYIIIYQDTSRIITLPTTKIYAQSLAPGGKLTIEGLKLQEV